MVMESFAVKFARFDVNQCGSAVTWCSDTMRFLPSLHTPQPMAYSHCSEADEYMYSCQGLNFVLVVKLITLWQFN